MFDVAFGILLAIWLLVWGPVLIYAIPVLLVMTGGTIGAIWVFCVLPPPGRAAVLLTVLGLVVIFLFNQYRCSRRAARRAARQAATQARETEAWRLIHEAQSQLEIEYCWPYHGIGDAWLYS